MPDYPRSCRLLKAEAFSAVFSFRRSVRGAHFSLHYGAPEKKESVAPRLGLVIGKKFMRRAVGRNAVKRMARECFRRLRPLLPPRDFVLRLTARTSKPDRALKQALAAEIDALFQKISVLFCEENRLRPQSPQPGNGAKSGLL
ncbi:MAG: ribonuclease P protein component [Zoogloeaceae bacterium]|nr:ribonuclease P protein component [Zoogloeaceae bacterium]